VLQYLTDLDVDFDVTLTGFELPEIDLLIGELSLVGDNDPADATVEVGAGPPVTRPGPFAHWRPSADLQRFDPIRDLSGLASSAPSLYSPTRPTTCPLPGTLEA